MSQDVDKAASLHTPLYDAHLAAGGKMVDFAGHALPVHYGSMIEEHTTVRTSAGMFDVSHMTIVDVEGEAAEAWLRSLLTGDVARLADGEALYGCMCNAAGGILDDLIVYRLATGHYRVIVNAATREKDLAWFNEHLVDGVSLRERDDLALIAIQGPEAMQRAASVVATAAGVEVGALTDLKRFSALARGDWFVGRTGYTGEDGLEVALPNGAAAALWAALLEAGVRPAGLGARDTLRLEAGLSLYGNELDESHTPYESGIGWTVDLADDTRDFIGRDVLAKQKAAGVEHRLVGLVLEGRGVLRAGQNVVVDGETVGTLLSGTFSPTRKDSIATARVFGDVESCDVLIRDKPQPARRVKLPFVRDGKPV
ncbi:MAG: glycine cleavage system protein T [Gammaproteobacteria bacterium]|nr:MAG: glycine cleavage system protein T [Gammaproteobacteria bacterium]